MEQFTASATVRCATTDNGPFILGCFPQKTLEFIKPKNGSDNDKTKMSSAGIPRIPDFLILVIPEASLSTPGRSCGWFRIRGVMLFIIEVKSGYKEKVKAHALPGPHSQVDAEVKSLFCRGVRPSSNPRTGRPR